MVFELWIFVGAVVVGEFEETFELGLRRGRGGGMVAEEVEIEFVVRVFGGTDESHAHCFLVEFEGGGGGFDADHGMVLWIWCVRLL